MASLESQISSLRDELATVYKTQGQNAQRLLSMNETLREKEELSRADTDNLRQARDDVSVLRKKVEQHSELMAEKDRTAQVRMPYLLFGMPMANRRRYADTARRDKHPSTGVRPNRRAQCDINQRQCQTASAMVRRQASRSKQDERSQRVL